MVWIPVFTIATTDSHDFRYCVPLDGHRPELNLKFYENICADQNGVSLRTFMTVFNETL
jgi:hypothetical protein